MENSFFTISELNIGYNGNSVVENINLQLTEGQLVVLIGRNGTGKTTLFKTISGQLPPILGRMKIKGNDFLHMAEKDRSSLISLVLTDRPKIAGLTVKAIVSMGRHPFTGFFGELSPQDNEIITQSLKDLNIFQIKDKSIDQISDGEFQKMMLARALAQDTPIILMDEPASFLDYPSKLELLNTLKKLCIQKKKLIIFSSHEIPILGNFADVVIGIKSGKIESFVSNGEIPEGVFRNILEY